MKINCSRVMRSACFGAAATIFCLAGPTNGSLLFYEDFEGVTGSNAGVSLDGQGGWTSPGNSINVHNGTIGQDGSTGTWDGSVSGSPTSGGNFIAPVFGGTVGLGNIALAPFVTNSFADGTTTWFSYTEYNANGGASARQNIAIGAAPLTALDGASMAGDGIGVATDGANTPRAAYWNAATGENAAASTIGSGRPLFVVAKIVWSDAGNDTITVKRWNQTTGIPAGLSEADWNAATELSTTSADLDQTTFDTLSIASGYAWFDEVRIANDFDNAVTGTIVVPEPGTLCLHLIGQFMAFASRRVEEAVAFRTVGELLVAGVPLQTLAGLAGHFAHPTRDVAQVADGGRPVSGLGVSHRVATILDAIEPVAVMPGLR
jgi:hypothetical protein